MHSAKREFLIVASLSRQGFVIGQTDFKHFQTIHQGGFFSSEHHRFLLRLTGLAHQVVNAPGAPIQIHFSAAQLVLPPFYFLLPIFHLGRCFFHSSRPGEHCLF